MKKQHKEKTKKVIRYWRSGNIYPPDVTDNLDKIIDSAISNESNEVFVPTNIYIDFLDRNHD